MPQIHPTAVVDRKAEIADDVAIGPYCVVDGSVRVGAGTVLDSHVILTGHTELGRNNRLYASASIGTPPQDHSHRGEATRLLIGDGNRFREFVTVNTGTIKGGGITIIGNDNLFMACSHVAHDCVVGDRCTIANCALLAGHVKLEDGCILSGHTAVHHFVTLGALSMLGGLTGVTHDVPPYMMMLIEHRIPRGVNVVGMQRAGYSEDEIKSVQRAFRTLYRSKLSYEEAAREIENAGNITAPVANLLTFIARSRVGRLGRYLEVTRQSAGGAA